MGAGSGAEEGTCVHLVECGGGTSREGCGAPEGRAGHGQAGGALYPQGSGGDGVAL